MKRNLLCLLLSLFLLLPCVSSCAEKEGSVTFFDRNGNVMAEITSLSFTKTESADPSLFAYLDLAAKEAVSAVSEEKGIDSEKAKRVLLQKNACIFTNFDPAVQKAVKEAYESLGDENLAFGSAATDLKGNLIACYSGGKYGNSATAKTPPYSSFKPLSVYMQALEKDRIHWSSFFEDSPLKKVVSTDGKEVDWPPNASGKYSYGKVTVAYALKQSLNTVASKCLWDFGVRNSVDFLKENFAVSLDGEESTMALSGQEEIIGNIAMGHLYEGVSPVEMAGFYQIFANGGTYTEPKAVESVREPNGKVLWQRNETEKRIVSTETAAIMNRLLQGVVSEGGTGVKAALETIPVGGKTGTGEMGNWFVGFTPEMTLSVWHGTKVSENCAPSIFSAVLSDLSLSEGVTYPESGEVTEVSFCEKSGLASTPDCKKSETGFYKNDRIPEFCTSCKK